MLAGKGGFAFDGDLDPMFNAIDDLLAPSSPTPGDTDGTPHAFRTLLFTDLESSTALTQSLGDEKAQEVLDGHDTAVRAALAANGVRRSNTRATGSSPPSRQRLAPSRQHCESSVSWPVPRSACALVSTRVSPSRRTTTTSAPPVQLAARVCDRAEPGQVLVPQVVRDLCRGKTFTFEDQGEATLKGFPEPVRLFVVGEGDQA